MDENYLDGLLNSVSSDGKKNNVEESVEKDSGINIDMSDLDDLSLDEFDDLGDLDGLDLGDLDFDDIDFDDIDITSLDSKAGKASKEPEEEDFSLEDLLDEPEEEAYEPEPEPEAIAEPKSVEPEPVAEPESLDGFSLDEFMSEGDSTPAAEEMAALNENNDNTSDDNSGDTSIEDLLSALEEPEVSSEQSTPDITEGGASSVDDMDLDDLFSALGIEEGGGEDADMAGIAANASIDSLDDALMDPEDFSGLEDIEDISEVKEGKGKKAKSKKEKKDKSGGDKEKKSLSQILFGEPEEEELEEEEQRKAKKAEKKEEKAKKKEENKEKKAEKLELKNSKSAEKKTQKADKKKQKADAAAAEAAAEAAEDAAAGNKPVPKLVTAIIFAAFAIGAALVVLGTNSFSYRQVIKKAADYFDRHRYRLAYDQVAGVDVKEKDQELKDRIYTVMYVERLYESYENNMKLSRPDKALDSLIRGLEKYDEHYDEAVELEIVDDINLCKANIIEALNVTFGLSEDEAYLIMSYEGQDYLDALNAYSGFINSEE